MELMTGRFEPGYVFPGTVYRVISHLASGGMGSLYEVEDDTVGRRYVLKTLTPELVERTDLAIRMREEARALGRLQHPNIVQVITAGVTADPQKMPFYVMERLVGQNLRTALEVRKNDGGIGLAHAYRIAIDVASALHHAHEHQLVHRDVKPENIFLHRGPTATEVKLVDFGIVRLLTREATLTRGKFIGTLKYASPEQITGLRPIGPASDIYALALVLYEMICRRGPFDDAPDHVKIGLAHAQEAPAPPSKFARDLPAEVDALIMRALAKEPEARPASAAVFADGLRAALRELDATPSHRTEVELLSAQHPIALGADHPTITSVGLPPTMAEGRALVPTRVEALLPPTKDAPLAAPGNAMALGPTALAQGTVTLETPRPAAQMAPQPPAPVAAPVAPRGIDRDAPTRVPAPNVVVRQPSNDTVVDAPAPPPVQQAPFASVPPPSSLPPPRAYASTVHTRKKADHRPFFFVGVAAAVALMMIAGALVFVRRPWGGHSAPAAVAPSK